MSESRTSRRNLVLPLLVAAAAAVVLLATLVDPGEGDEAADEAASTSTPAQTEPAPDTGDLDLARRDADDPMALGDVDAPVVMIAYSEFQCPFCGKFSRDTVPVLVDKYVDEGTLRIEWRDFPYLGPESTTAALAGRAAAAQDRFWEFHDAMFDNQLPPNSGNLDEAYVESLAEQVGLDVERFRDDMGASSTVDLVATDFAEGQSLGVNGTPSFLVNGTPVVGAQPVEVFEQAIEDAADRS